MGGGSQTQDTNSTTVNKPPKWFNDAAIKSLEVADKINQAGYVPYMGNQVAAFTPMQQQAMQGVSDWASAANGTGRVDAMAGMPQASVDGSGVAGYDSARGFMRNLDLLRERFPKQYDQLSRFGGDLLSDPSRPPSDMPESPWQVGEEAKKSWKRQNGGGAGYGAFGMAGGPYSLKQLLSEGAKDGGSGAMMAFMGLPYGKRSGPGSPMQQTSAFQRLYNRDILWGRNPWARMQPPAEPPKEDPPLPVYNSPDKWW